MDTAFDFHGMSHEDAEALRIRVKASAGALARKEHGRRSCLRPPCRVGCLPESALF